MKKVVELLIFLPFTMKERMRLGTKLGLPMGEIESIELEVSRRTSRKQQKKVALKMMMRYWFENDKKASLRMLADILAEMNMNRPNEQAGQVIDTIRMLIWNAALEEKDIDFVVEAIGRSIPDQGKVKKVSNRLAEKLKVKGKHDKRNNGENSNGILRKTLKIGLRTEECMPHGTSLYTI